MLALGVSQALEGSTTTASTLTITITGLLMNSASPPVTTSYEVLYQGQLSNSAASIYNPGGSATALISSINLMNTSSSIVQVVNLYLEGTAAANQIATINVPTSGWATYEDGTGWRVFSSAGLQVNTTNLPNSNFRNASATLNIDENTIFNGSTTSQTLTLPAAPPDASYASISNYATVAVSVASGAGGTLNIQGTTGTYSLVASGMLQLVYSASQSTWYSIATNIGNLDVGPGSVQAGVVTTTQTVNTTTLTNVTALSLPLLASNQYRFESELYGTNSATASTGFGIAVTVPAGATLTYDVIGNSNSSATVVKAFVTTNTIQTGFMTTSGFTGFVKVVGAVIMSTATGSINMQFCSYTGSTTAAGTATVNIGSHLVVTQL